MLDFVNINRTFACVAKRTFKKLHYCPVKVDK